MNKIVPCSPRGDIVSLSPFLDSQMRLLFVVHSQYLTVFVWLQSSGFITRPAGAFHIWKANSPHHTQPNSIIVKNMGPVPGVRLWQPRSQGSLLPVQARDYAGTAQRNVSERKKKKTGVEIYNTYGPLFKRSLTKAAV